MGERVPLSVDKGALCVRILPEPEILGRVKEVDDLDQLHSVLAAWQLPQPG